MSNFPHCASFQADRRPKMNKAMLFSVLIIYAQLAHSCGPVKPNQQFCVTMTLGGFTATTQPHLNDTTSLDFKQMKHIVILELDRVIQAKNWKSRLNPPPQFCRFETSPTNQDTEVNTLINVWANADAADLQKELDPSTVILNPPPLYPVDKVVATQGPCPVSGNATCHP